FLGYVWPNSSRPKWCLLIRVLLVFLQRVSNIFLPYQMSVFSERLFNMKGRGTSNEATVKQVLYIILIWRVLGKCFQVFQSPLWNRVVQLCRRNLSDAALGHIFKLGQDYHAKHSVSEKTLVVGKSRAIDKLIEEVIFRLLPALIDLVLAVGYTLSRFGICCATKVGVFGCCYISFTLWSASRIAQLEKKRLQAKELTVNVRGDLTGAYETVQMLQAEADARARHKITMCNEHDFQNNVKDWCAMSDIIQEAIYTVGLSILLQSSIAAVTSGKSTDTDTLAFFTLLLQLQTQLSSLGECFTRCQSAIAGSDRIFSLLEETPAVVNLPSALELPSCEGHITFSGVGFTYGRQSVLRDISFSCSPGKVTAIVGSSGAGKSTIFKLLFRDIDIQQGIIYIDGHDIRNLTLESLRRYISPVSQSPVLLNRTIIENLRLANSSIADVDIYRICQSLGFDEKFRMLGYNTSVGDKGDRLSGGEKMMVAITMAMIKNSKIVLLDEATGPFDPIMEQSFQNALQILKFSRTVIIIAHRESSIRHADNIFLLRKGMLYGGETHNKLLETNEDYSQHWKNSS
ncbi:P-loop containing nucleoside triphosphate hydrolase protein, partial [Tricladium varicosporioides]